MAIGLGYKDRSCAGKVRYKAKQAIAVAKKRHIEAYYCSFCHRWHVGHRSLY